MTTRHNSRKRTINKPTNSKCWAKAKKNGTIPHPFEWYKDLIHAEEYHEVVISVLKGNLWVAMGYNGFFYPDLSEASVHPDDVIVLAWCLHLDGHHRVQSIILKWIREGTMDQNAKKIFKAHKYKPLTI